MRASRVVPVLVAAAALVAGCTNHTPPALTASPADGATNVPANIAALTLKASLALDPASVNAQSVTLTGSAKVDVKVALSPDGRTITVTPPEGGLGEHTAYTLAAKNLKVTKEVGDGILASFSSKFTTGGLGPKVVSITPADGTKDVDPGKLQVVVTFDSAMDATTTAAAISLSPAVSGTTTLSDDGKTATWTPDDPAAVQEKTSYTVTVAASAQDADDHTGLAAQAEATFTTGNAPPRLVSTVPADNATGIDPTAAVSLTFSEPLAALADASAIQLMHGTDPVAATAALDANGTTVTLTPASRLLENADYTVVVSAAAVDADDGLPLDGAPVTALHFTTGSTPLAVLSSSPADEATDVNGGTSLTVSFSAPLSVASVTPAHVRLLAADGAPSDLALALDETGTVLTATPTAPLEADTDYTLTLSTGLEDYSGIALAADLTIHFHTATGPTVTSVSPTDGAQNQNLTTAVEVGFSGPVVGVTPATFTVRANGQAVAGQVTVTGTGASFVPAAPLEEATTYTVDLTRDVTDPNGNRLTPFSSSFTTVGGVPKVTHAALLAHAGDAGTEMELTGAAPTPDAVLAGAIVSLSFDHALDLNTLDGITLTDPSGNAIATTIAGTNSGSQSAGSATVTATIASLPYERTTYTLTVPTSVKSEAGVSVAAPVTLRLTSAAKPRLFTSPQNLAEAVPTNAGVFVVFNRPMHAPQVTTDLASPQDLTMLVAPLDGSAAPALQKIGVTMDASGKIAFIQLKNAVGSVVALAPSSRYTLTVAGTLADATGTALGADVVHVFQTGAGADQSAFAVTQITPADQTTNVPADSLSCKGGNHGVRVQFSGPVDPRSATSANFRLLKGSTALAATVVVPDRFPGAANEVDLCPADPLLPDTTYSVSVSSAVKSVTGAAAGAAGISFTTAADVAPSPAKVLVSDSAVNQGTSNEGTIAPDSALQIRFGDVMIDPATLDVVLTAVTSTGTSSTVAASVSYDRATNSALVTPASALHGGDTLNVTVRAGLASLLGTATTTDLLAGSFQVRSSTDQTAPMASLASPAATDASYDASVTVSFTKNLDPRTLEAAGALQVTGPDGKPVSGTIVGMNTTQVTFRPSPGVYFAGNATYTVHLGAGIADLAGNQLPAASRTLTFATHARAPAPLGNDVAAGELASLSPLTIDFDSLLDPATEQASVAIHDVTANQVVAGSVSEQVRPNAGARTTLVVVPSSPWLRGHSYEVAVDPQLHDLGGLALASEVDTSFQVSTGPSITAAVFAPAENGAPKGGFAANCAGFTAQNAVLDIPQLPGKGSGDSCRSSLALADMPLWIHFSGALDAASAGAAANFQVKANGSALAVTPRYDATGHFVEIDPPNGSWMPALPAPTYPVGERYTLTVSGVKDASGTAMSSSSTLSFRTVVVSMYEDATTAAQESTYATSTTPEGLVPQDVWSWHPGDVKGLAGVPSWVTDPTATDYARDCESLPRNGSAVTMAMRTPDHGFGAMTPTTDVLLRVSQLYGVNASAGDFLAISVSANGGGGQQYALVGGGGHYSFASSGQSAGYAQKAFAMDEYSIVKEAGLFGGQSGLAALPGIRAQFELTAQGFQTSIARACPATDLGWAIGSYAIVAY